ncbi:hypothetical protein [Embleya sp. NBC_00896]|uniref:hypothetical protein n=1 Tax=Embleya sp. NBC_00896 TaxID=2975961 RepID=UPI00386BB86E|nr:hypothetical protein OG928_27780 [Embleya sp. NBC_00896]
MYSQHSIAGHRRSSRPETTVEMTYGLACTMCGRDLRVAEGKPTPDAVPIGRVEERQTFACRGVCARLASGSADGNAEEPVPLDERIRAFAAAPPDAPQATPQDTQQDAQQDAQNAGNG